MREDKRCTITVTMRSKANGSPALISIHATIVSTPDPKPHT